MVRLPVKKTTRLLEGESKSKVVGCNNTSFVFAKLQKTMNSRKRFKEKKQKNLFLHLWFKSRFFLFASQCLFCLSMIEASLGRFPPRAHHE